MSSHPVNQTDKNALLVADLVSNDEQLGPTLRAVYDASAGQSTAFMATLQGFTTRMDGEIERMCNKYYQDFIESIEELLKVRANASELRDLINDANDSLIESGQMLLQTAEDLVQARTVQRNIVLAINSLTKCLPVLRLYVKAIGQMSKKRFYPALKTLEALEQEHLPTVSRYTFAKLMASRIGRLRDKVKHQSFSELQDFLANIRDRSKEIGQSAMDQTQQSQTMDVTYGDVDFGGDLCASDQADFSPIYRCLHIYDVLGIREECQQYYKEERKKQGLLTLQPLSKMGTTSEFQVYFYKVAGFFLVEDTVLTTTKDLLTRQWVDDLWEVALSKISTVVHSQLENCTTATMIHDVKRLIVLFCNTVAGYGYNVTPLLEILLQVRQRYSIVLLSKCAEKFNEILRADTCSPIVAENEDEFNKVLEQYPYDDRILQEAPFPRTFPFSQVVPETYQTVKEFIDKCLQFVENLSLSHTEIDEMVRRTTNQLLSKTLSGVMAHVIRNNNLGLIQLTQMSVNTTYLEKSCSVLEKYISSVTHSFEDDNHMTRLHGASTFKDARTAAEDRIFSVFQSKIDECMELASYDWTPSKPSQDSSDFIFDLLAYLTTMFASLTNLPVDVGRAAYFSTCKYIAGQLIDILNSDSIKKINMNGMLNFSLDIETCEQYAKNCPLKSSDGSLSNDDLFTSVFLELRGLADLFIHQEWDVFFDPVERRRKYPQVKPAMILRLMERYDNSTQKTKFGFKTGDDKKKGKEIDVIVKRLRALVADSMAGST